MKKNAEKNFFFHWLVLVTSNIDPYVIEWLIAQRVPNPLISFWHHIIPDTLTNPYMYHTCIMYQIPTNGTLSNPICVSFFVQYILFIELWHHDMFHKYTGYSILYIGSYEDPTQDL